MLVALDVMKTCLNWHLIQCLSNFFHGIPVGSKGPIWIGFIICQVIPYSYNEACLVVSYEVVWANKDVLAKVKEVVGKLDS